MWFFSVVLFYCIASFFSGLQNFPELFQFMDEGVIVDLCWGTETGVSYVAILVMSLKIKYGLR